MAVTRSHVCLAEAGAPAADGGHEVGTRWVCPCGANFVFREGFDGSGRLRETWWPAAPVPRPRRSVRNLLRPRQG